MNKCKRVVFVGLLVVMLGTKEVMAQVTHSPYSAIGIGDIQDNVTAAKFGMGGLGVSNGSYYNLNLVNPALLHYNRVALFSAAVLGETKTINQDGFESYAAGSGQLNHMALAFPLLSGKLSTSLVLNPYSAVNYNLSYLAPIQGHPTDSTQYTAKGDGGIDQLSLSLGGELFKGFSLGARASYMFSSIRKESKSVVPLTPINNYLSTLNERLSFSDFTFGLGLAYKFTINKKSSINVGATYDFSKDLKSKLFIRLDQEQFGGGTVFGDTLANDEPVLVHLPEKWAVGLSYNIANKLVVGVDYSSQDWSQTKDVTSGTNIYTKRENYVFGVEITPDITSINNYFNRITYRAGAIYTNTPYIINGIQIRDFGINFGLSLPVVRFSSLDFGVQLGTRGTLTENLVQENYIKVYFGVSFNDNRWFIKPKFN